MELLEKFQNFDRTILLFKMQVVDSLKFAEHTMSKLNINNPEDLWKYLKPRLHFKDDEPGFEDFQSMQTLFLKKGRGDCDCFAITTTACCVVLQWEEFYVDLVGVNNRNATHIYNDVVFNGNRQVLDFTNPRFNMERNKNPKGQVYKYRQRLRVGWKNWF